jgi:hypothetical protein
MYGHPTIIPCYNLPLFRGKSIVEMKNSVHEWNGNVPCMVSQPHFWKSVRMAFTLPKWGLGGSSRTPKISPIFLLITGVIISPKRKKTLNSYGGV